MLGFTEGFPSSGEERLGFTEISGAVAKECKSVSIHTNRFKRITSMSVYKDMII
jgi:hypothetical protein